MDLGIDFDRLHRISAQQIADHTRRAERLQGFRFVGARPLSLDYQGPSMTPPWFEQQAIHVSNIIRPDLLQVEVNWRKDGF